MSSFKVFYNRFFSKTIMKNGIVYFIVSLFYNPIDKLNEYIDNQINEDI